MVMGMAKIRTSLDRVPSGGPSDDFIRRIRREAWHDWDRWTLIVSMDDPAIRQDEWDKFLKFGTRTYGARAKR